MGWVRVRLQDGAALGMIVDHPVAQQDAANQTAIPELVPASQLQPGLTDPDLKVEGWVKISPSHPPCEI